MLCIMGSSIKQLFCDSLWSNNCETTLWSKVKFNVTMTFCLFTKRVKLWKLSEPIGLSLVFRVYVTAQLTQSCWCCDQCKSKSLNTVHVFLWQTVIRYDLNYTLFYKQYLMMIGFHMKGFTVGVKIYWSIESLFNDSSWLVLVSFHLIVLLFMSD